MNPPSIPESFEEVGLGPELIEALAAEGIERPTPLQADVIPVVRRGNDLVVGAGPGAGCLVACAAPLFDRVPSDRRDPGVLILAANRGEVMETALSLARIAAFTGHRVGALGVPWALPGSAGVLVSTPEDLAPTEATGTVDLTAVEAAVVYGVGSFPGVGALDELDRLLGSLPTESQKVLVSLPLGDASRKLADRHLRREVYLPAGAAAPEDASDSPRRGRIAFQVNDDPDEAAPEAVGRMLEEGARHVALFFRSEVRMADVGDRVHLHGFACERPGDEGAPVWLTTDDMEVRQLLRELEDPTQVATLSVDVPFDADSLDRRHGAGGPARILVRPRELPHLRAVAREAGYGLLPPESAAAVRMRDDARRFAEGLEEVLETEDIAPFLLLLEPVLVRWSAEEAAAGLALLLRRRAEAAAGPAGAEPGRPPAWVRLFVSIGERDGVGPGDLLGAVTGEAGIDGSQVGKIEIRDNFSRIEVEEGVARRLLRALNGITFRGRSVRADYDRTEARGRGPSGGGRGTSGRDRRP